MVASWRLRCLRVRHIVRVVVVVAGEGMPESCGVIDIRDERQRDDCDAACDDDAKDEEAKDAVGLRVRLAAAADTARGGAAKQPIPRAPPLIALVATTRHDDDEPRGGTFR
jgi:hypothetical protein